MYFLIKGHPQKHRKSIKTNNNLEELLELYEKEYTTEIEKIESPSTLLEKPKPIEFIPFRYRNKSLHENFNRVKNNDNVKPINETNEEIMEFSFTDLSDHPKIVNNIENKKESFTLI